jgi:hypothetical protein
LRALVEQALDLGRRGRNRRQRLALHQLDGAVERLRGLREAALLETRLAQRRGRLPQNLRRVGGDKRRLVFVDGPVLRHHRLRVEQTARGQAAQHRNPQRVAFGNGESILGGAVRVIFAPLRDRLVEAGGQRRAFRALAARGRRRRAAANGEGGDDDQGCEGSGHAEGSAMRRAGSASLPMDRRTHLPRRRGAKISRQANITRPPDDGVETIAKFASLSSP